MIRSIRLLYGAHDYCSSDAPTRARLPLFTRTDPTHGLNPSSSTRTSCIPSDTFAIDIGARPTTVPSSSTCASRGRDMISIEPPSAVVAAAVGCGRGVVEGRVVDEGIDARRVDRGTDAAGVAVESATSVALTTLGPRADSVEGSGVGFARSTDSTGGTVDDSAVRAGA